MAGALKKSTRLTGLTVCKNPHLELTSVYERILRMLKLFPKDYTYQKETEKLIKDRLRVVKEVGLIHPDIANVETLEKKIGCGQVEELIIQAQNELSLTEKMLIWKPWEKLIEEAPPNQWTWPPHK